VEYDALGVPFRARGRRLEEQVDVLRRLWSEPLVTLHGQHHDIERAGILPMPREPIPIWFGGGAEAQLRRAARLGDGFLASRADERARAQVQQLMAFRAEEGRAATPDADTGGFAVAGMLDWAHGPDACGEAIAAWRDAGGTHVALRTFDTLAGRIGVPALGYTSVDEHLDALARFRDVAASVL
jgi:alkanesulfonate monooxygenase SsuD/methylene tetrahydromethanopterin reductase-like flavin-dependent oxidoreductase (luciferase family)